MYPSSWCLGLYYSLRVRQMPRLLRYKRYFLACVTKNFGLGEKAPPSITWCTKHSEGFCLKQRERSLMRFNHLEGF